MKDDLRAPGRHPATGAPVPPARRRSPLRRPEFRLYFIGNAISNIGTWLANVALAAFMLDLTHSSFWVGLTGAALFVPVLLFAVPAGAWADRTDRLRLLRASQFLAGSLATVLTIMVATDTVSRYAVVAIAAGLGLTIALGIPAMQSLIPSLVPPEEMHDAIGLNALTFNLARAIGPIIAAAILTTSGAVWAFGINAASYIAIVGALTIIRRPPFPRTADGAPGGVRDGIRYAWTHHPTRTMLLSIMAISLALDPIITLSPALVRSFGLESGSAGWIVSAWGAGAVAGITLGRSLIRRAVEHGLGWMGLVGMALGLVALGASHGMATGIPSAVLIGAGYIIATIAFTTAIQSAVPERLRGRVMALWTVCFLAPRAVSAVTAGAMADAFGPHWSTASFAIVALGAAWFVRRMIPPRAEPVPPQA